MEIDVYDVMKEKYPSDYSQVDAVIISGSTSSAYDADAWIQRLQVNIRC
jgi:GMP synthase-like glutamine amidotransferase